MVRGRLRTAAFAIGVWALAACVLTHILRSNDLVEYQHYARDALRAPLFHAFPTEYPPTALAVFLLPLTLPLSYKWSFALIVGIFLLALTWTYPSGGRKSAIPAHYALLAYFAIGAGTVLTNRYDIFAACVTYWALRSGERGRWNSAWAWSSVGFLLKFFPAVLWPVLLIAERRATGRTPLRRLSWVGISALLVAGIPLLLNRREALNAFRFYLHRPTEIGSLAAGASLLLQWSHWTYHVGFQTENAVSSLVAPLTVTFTALAFVGFCATLAAQAKGLLRMDEAVLLSLTLVVLGSKVISTQYLIWLIPIWALYGLRSPWVLAGTLNTAVFAVLAWTPVSGPVSARHLVMTTTLLNLGRDLAIVIGTVVVAREAIRARPPLMAPETAGAQPL